MTAVTIPKTPQQSEDLTARIRKPSAATPNISAVIYGHGGTGKTSLLATMPPKLRGLVLDVPQIEGGTHVLADAAEYIDVLEIEEWRHLQQVYQMLSTQQWKYDWVGIDTITAMQRLAIRKTVKERRLDEDPNAVHLQDWGKVGNLMAELVFRWGTLPMHKIWLAQERRRDNSEGVLSYMPDVSPLALSSLIPPQYLVGRLSVAEAPGTQPGAEIKWERHLRVGPHPAYETKIRTLPSRPLPNIIRNPNLSNIFGWILGSPRATTPEGVVELMLETL